MMQDPSPRDGNIYANVPFTIGIPYYGNVAPNPYLVLGISTTTAGTFLAAGDPAGSPTFEPVTFIASQPTNATLAQAAPFWEWLPPQPCYWLPKWPESWGTVDGAAPPACTGLALSRTLAPVRYLPGRKVIGHLLST